MFHCCRLIKLCWHLSVLRVKQKYTCFIRVRSVVQTFLCFSHFFFFWYFGIPQLLLYTRIHTMICTHYSHHSQFPKVVFSSHLLVLLLLFLMCLLHPNISFFACLFVSANFPCRRPAAAPRARRPPSPGTSPRGPPSTRDRPGPGPGSTRVSQGGGEDKKQVSNLLAKKNRKL